MSNDFERIIRVAPAYDERATGRGIHCAELQFYLKGKLGTIQFVVHTGWYPPGTFEEGTHEIMQKVTPSHIGWHSPKPTYKGEQPIEDHCDWVAGPCYFTSSGTEAPKLFEKLVSGGDKDVWAHLEQIYSKVFGE